MKFKVDINTLEVELAAFIVVTAFLVT
jgi:hypothetical protein